MICSPRGAAVLQPEAARKSVESRECLRPLGKSDPAEVFRRLERDIEQASAKPQVKIVKRHEAAAMLGVSTRTLQRWHNQGSDPPGQSVSASTTSNPRFRSGSRTTVVEASDPTGGIPRPRTRIRILGASPRQLTARKWTHQLAFITPEDANSSPCDKPAAINCTKVDTQDEVSGMLVAGSSDV
jgi:hypothetical protein